ncbi:MAG: type II toxin-antitoxin system mRNA interferase toxin, RelE/StbE family [Bacteroidetes bacterium]|nr:type II toxin-antitoxin system mRNA interferase toxin, RelE/StbE family [Bacteroidota bacterium]
MIEIFWDNHFKKAYKKRTQNTPYLKRKLAIAILKFEKNPFEKSLNTHKLSGSMSEYWSFKVDYNCRIIFKFIDESKVIFYDVGTHDQVY